jgi:hypothetical protein
MKSEAHQYVDYWETVKTKGVWRHISLYSGLFIVLYFVLSFFIELSEQPFSVALSYMLGWKSLLQMFSIGIVFAVSQYYLSEYSYRKYRKKLEDDEKINLE